MFWYSCVSAKAAAAAQKPAVQEQPTGKFCPMFSQENLSPPLGSDSWNRPIIGRNYAVVANFRVRNYRLQKFQIHESDLEPNYVVATYTRPTRLC